MDTTLRRIMLPAVAVFAVFAIQLILSNSVFAATVTWDGEGDNTTFNDGTNWVGDTAPGAGDDLVFDTDTVDFDNFLENDSGNNAFNSIAAQGTDSETVTFDTGTLDLGAGGVVTSGSAGVAFANSVTLTSDQDWDASGYNVDLSTSGTLDLGSNTLTVTGTQTVALLGNVSGSGGNIIGDTNLFMTGSNDFTGTVTQNSDTLYISSSTALGDVAGATTVADGATLCIGLGVVEDLSIADDITIGGEGNGSVAGLYVGTGCVAGGPLGDLSTLPEYRDLDFTGTVTLSADTTYDNFSPYFHKSTVTFDDIDLASFAFTRVEGSSGTLIFGTTTQAKAPVKTTTFSDSQPASQVIVYPNNTVLVTGSRGDIQVLEGGILKGSGTVGAVEVYSGGTLATGTSPGCLATGDLSFTSGSTFTVEVEGTTECTEYDQTQVTGTVSLGDATLEVLVDTDFDPEADDEFIIIDNDGTDDVTGTFDGLAEGATFTLDGVVYEISYAGGDGNDVVLTVQDVPGTPDTGFGLITSNYLVVMAVTLVSSMGLIALAGLKARQN